MATKVNRSSIYYALAILKGDWAALLSAMEIAVVYLAMTSVGLALVDRAGRRWLSLAMSPGAAVSLVACRALFMLGLAGPGHA